MKKKMINSQISNFKTYNMYFRQMLTLAENVFEFKNLPEFVDVSFLNKYLGLTKGSVSPLGAINDTSASVEFIIDNEFKNYPCVGVHPNQNTSTVWLSFEDLVKVIEENGNKIDFINI